MSRFIVCDHPQGSPEWKADRIGKATSSRADAIMAKGRIKGTEAVTRRNYRFQLALERLTGKIQESEYTNRHMERGNELEPLARMAYEVQTGELVEEAGFAYLPEVAAGCSVDGFVEAHGQLGITEFKCPIPAIHYEYMQRGTPPAEYMPQITHLLWVTGLPFVDFASYCPDMPDKLQLHVVRLLRDEAAIKAHEAEVLQFLSEVDDLEGQLRKRAA